MLMVYMLKRDIFLRYIPGLDHKDISKSLPTLIWDLIIKTTVETEHKKHERQSVKQQMF